MEDLAPPLELLLSVKSSIEKGKSIQDGIKRYFTLYNEQPFGRITRQWLVLIERQMATQEFVNTQKSIHRRQLLQLLEKGIKKEPIYNQILILEHEIYQACESEIQEAAPAATHRPCPRPSCRGPWNAARTRPA